MKHLYFCRHGESEANKAQVFAGHLDTPLTDFGREQAKLAGLEAALLGIDFIVTSPLVRALETGQIIARECNYPLSEIHTNVLLKERALGSLQGKSWHEHREDDGAAQGVESLESLGARAQQFLNYLDTIDAPNVLVVGHGSFALALCDLLNYDTGGQELPNAHMVQLM